MSALPPKADIERGDGRVRFVPKADLRTAARNDFGQSCHATAFNLTLASKRSSGCAFNVERYALGRQNFPLNLPTNRRLCSTVGGRIVEGAAHCCAVSAARSRAATMTNLARSSLALVLPALFGAAKSCALVNVFMTCPRWSASGQPTTIRFCL